MSWETVIGLEIHAQLSTKSKLFSGGSTEFGAESNTHVDLVDMGLPGVLPVANKEAFYKAIRFGLATGADINQTSSFDRKNYFYPDLPKGYQITQMTKPIVEKGSIKILVDDYEKIINEFALLRNKWLGITKGLDQKQWQITNIVKLRVAGMEDASI